MRHVDKKEFQRGLISAWPIAVGYFAVSFTLGIAAGNAGLTWIEAALMSFLNNTSAGEAAGISIIASKGHISEIVLSQIVINLRYLLMSAALSVKLRPATTTKERLLMSFEISDELFGLSVMQQGPLNAWFTIGSIVCVCPCWTAGTALGVVMGNILPSSVARALSLALYAMFIAVILPSAKHNLILAVLIVISMLSSALFDWAKTVSSFMAGISSGMKTIILTVLLSAIVAYLFPVKDEKEAGYES